MKRSTATFQIVDAVVRYLDHEHAVIRLFGRAENGESITADVYDVVFAMYAPYWRPEWTEAVNAKLPKLSHLCRCRRCGGRPQTQQLYKGADVPNDGDGAIHGDEPCWRRAREPEDAIVRIEMVEARSLVGFHQDARGFARIVVSSPCHLRPITWLVDRVAGRPLQWYEADVDPVTRCMVDHGIVGGGWCTIQGKAVETEATRTTHHYAVRLARGDTIRPVPREANAPLRTLAHDIEVMATDIGRFPTADRDPVIQIATVTSVYGSTDPPETHVFVQGGCEPVGAGVTLHAYEGPGAEAALLSAFATHVTASDVDVISGYNSNLFDLPYLFERARVLGLHRFALCTKETDAPVRWSRSVFESRQTGKRDVVRWTVPGIVCFDVLDAVRSNYKLRSYTLDNVARHFLTNQHKDAMDYTQIPVLQGGDDADRARLARYCVQDTRLVQQLTDELQLLVNALELAKVIGCRLDDCLTRGQSFKIKAKLLRVCRPTSTLVPTYRRDRETGATIVPEYPGASTFQGATVVEPVKGYYTCPTAVLDFAALYPSIMSRYNLSHDTLVLNRDDQPGLTDDDLIETPMGALFVKPHVRKGILPTLLEDLLQARQRAKRQKKEATDPFEVAVFDAKQLALKVCCNSVYGFTGAAMGALPCPMISASVTAFGRTMIADTSTFMRERYGAKTVYGDTDSVFVQYPAVDGETPLEARRRAHRISVEAQRAISGSDGIFQSPIVLEYEKVLEPFLLLGKKRYCARQFETDMQDFTLSYTGIELKRRDNAPVLGRTQREFLEALLLEQDFRSAMQTVQRNVRRLVTRDVPLEELIISKKLAKSGYKTAQIHSNLNERIRARSPAKAYHLGDRIPFVVVNNGAKAVTDRGEDPDYVREHQVPIDTQYYVVKQLRVPMSRLIVPLVGKRAFDKFFDMARGGAADRFFASSLQGYIPPLLTSSERNHVAGDAVGSGSNPNPPQDRKRHPPPRPTRIDSFFFAKKTRNEL